MGIINDFTLGSDILYFELYSESYTDLCETLDELTSLFDDELYVEEVNDPRVKAKEKKEGIIKRTVDTTRDVAGAYDRVTSANGNLLKATWDLVMKSVNLCIGVLTWLINKIASIPKFILSVINKVSEIPPSIKAKIRGDIRIYITPKDISTLYTASMLLYIEQFLSQLEVLVEGDMWTTFFRRGPISAGALLGRNDLGVIKKMTGIYNNIKSVNFDQTTIPMKDAATIDVYFGNAKVVKFTDLSGNHHNCSYLEALEQLVKDLGNHQKLLKNLQKDLGEKFNRSRENKNFAELHPNDQRRVASVMQMVSKVVGIVGNLARYSMADLKVIHDTTNKLIKKGKLKPDDQQNN